MLPLVSRANQGTINVTLMSTGLDNNHAAQQVRRTLASYQVLTSSRQRQTKRRCCLCCAHKELHPGRMKFKLAGRGNQPIDIASLATAIEFASLPRGRAAAQAKRQAAMLLRAAWAGT